MDQRIKRICQTVAGWLRVQEGQLLFELAQRVSNDRAIVELGSYQGRSTACLAIGSLAGKKAKVYAIDPHLGSPEHRRVMGSIDSYAAFRANMKHFNLESVVVPVRQTSLQAAVDLKSEPIGLLFIDAQHEVAAVRQDIELWLPRVAAGGYIALHDVLHSDYLGPWLVMMNMLVVSDQFISPHRVKSLVYGQKIDGGASWSQRLYNLGFALWLFVVSFRYLLFWLVKAPFKLIGVLKNRVDYN